MNRRSLTALFVAVALLVSPTLALAAPGGSPALEADDRPTAATSGAGVAAASTLDHRPDPPQFETIVPEPELVPGRQQQLTIQLLNDADDPEERLQAAQNARVTVGSGDGPVEVVSGERLVGTIRDGQPTTVNVRVDLPASAEPGTYELPVTIRYEHRNDDGDMVNNSTTVTATVRVDERPRFSVVETNSSAPIGDSGTMNVTIENVGSATATDAAVSLQSTTASVAFGQSASASQYVGTWEPGERRTLQYDVSVTPDAEQRRYSMQATVAYEDQDGQPSQSRALRLGIVPDPEQSFAIGGVESSLRVGQEGEVVARITNEGDRRVENVVVLFDPTSPTVSPKETQYAVGTLGPGESATVRFDAEVTDTAESGPRQFTFNVQYRNVEGEKRTSDPLDARVVVGERQPEFTVDGAAATVTAGQDGVLELTVTNNRDETLRDISAKLFADSPISTGDDEAFVEQLEPGESATLKFGVSAAGGAMEKTYPVEVDFRYDDSEGSSHISDTYQVPVQVTQPEDTGGPLSGNLPVVVAVVVVVLLALVGGYLYVSRE